MSYRFAPAVATLCLLFAGPGHASAEYPEKPIVLIAPFAAGGPGDTIARIVGEHMAKTLGQPIIIENVPGAGGTTATNRVSQAVADGYTIMLGTLGTHGAAPAQYANLRYNPAKDFTPIGLISETPAVIVAKRNFPANTLKEFIDYIVMNQNNVNEAHAGVGSVSHMMCTLLHSIVGTKTVRVAYRGGGPAINDIVAGQVDFGCFPLSAAVSQIQGGTLKAIAIASTERAPVIKEVPTTAESGLPAFQISSWEAMLAPKNLPLDIQTRLTEALHKALNDPTTSNRLIDIGCLLPAEINRTPHALQKRVESEVGRWASVLKPAGALPK